ncbi:AAA family ATPase, partial [Fructobacillus tropaeoli]
MAKVITTGNFKGGVGKTTNSVLLSYTLSKLNKKV